MNSALLSYIELTDVFCKLCQALDKNEFIADVVNLEALLKKVNEFRLFPFDVDIMSVSILKDGSKEWESDRNELCRQLYVAIATLMYRFETSNIHNRAYFDYMLELGRTCLPYEITNEWGKEYVQDIQFSHEGFFFALNRDSRFLHKTKQDYYDYCTTIRERAVPDKPIEKAIPITLMKDMASCYNG